MERTLIEQFYKALTKEQQTAVKIISECADLYGINAYIIGGVVRDLILEKPIYDIDFVVECNAIDFCRFMEEKKFCEIVRISEDFGTTKIKIDKNLELDIASTRTEKYPRAGHLPVVEQLGCSLKEDILRRDFSVNALAMSVNSKNFGVIIDYTNGLTDIEKKELRILHEKSFVDDPTRIIRALRFEQKLGFTIEKNTQKFIQKYLNEFDNNDICYERIKQVIKLAFSLNSEELFDKFILNNIYKLVANIPRKISGKQIFDAVKNNIAYIEQKNIWLIYLACFCLEKDVEKLNLSAKEHDIILGVQKLLENSEKKETNFEIYNYYKPFAKESIVAYLALTKSAQAEKFLSEIQFIKLEIDGNFLIKEGCQKGKNIGIILEKILKEKINKKIFTKKDEIKLAKKILSEF